MSFRFFALAVMACTLSTACSGPAPSSGEPRAPAQAVESIPSPAAPGSAEPNLLAGNDGRLYLSWIEPAGDGHAVRFSVWEDDGWSAPRTVATGDDWFVNWADFPAMAALADGTLAAHWLAKSGASTYAYDVMTSVSRDGGETWSAPVRPHDDGTPTEHGFVSWVAADDRFGLVWLDGRQTAGEPRGPMTLRYGTLDRDGTRGPDANVDDNVCDCCQTDAVLLDDGAVVVAYRDRVAVETADAGSVPEVRDISIARLDGETWSAPVTIHDDDWRTQACPVNGPALAASGSRVACAWFTMPEPRAGKVRVAFSDDGGKSFGGPVRVDMGNPAGRVDVTWLDDGSALVSWLELGEPASVQVRRVLPSGEMDQPLQVTDTSGARSSGFPRIARHDGATFIAWTAPGKPSEVRTAVLR